MYTCWPGRCWYVCYMYHFMADPGISEPGAWSGRGRILESFGLFWCPLIQVYVCFSVKIDKNKHQKIFQTGKRAPGAQVLDPPLDIKKYFVCFCIPVFLILFFFNPWFSFYDQVCKSFGGFTYILMELAIWLTRLAPIGLILTYFYSKTNVSFCYWYYNDLSEMKFVDQQQLLHVRVHTYLETEILW